MDSSELSGGAASSYSAITIDHFRRPRNVGRLPDASAVGTVDDPVTENLITIYLRAEHGRIAEARFRALACSACIAASSMLTELVRGRTLADARALDQAALLSALDGLPDTKLHCASLAIQALRAALDAAPDSPATPTPPSPEPR